MTCWKMSQGAARVLVSALAIGGAAGMLVVLLLWLAGYFHAKVPMVPTASAAEAVPAGPLATVRRVRRPRQESAVGTVRAISEAAVASKLLARVVDVRVKAGQAVTAGDVLVQLDDAELQARVKQATAAREAGEAMLARAAQDQERARRLVTEGAISQQDADAALATLRAAQAEKERLDQALTEAQVMREFATIRSPLTGIVIDKRIEPGDTASPGQVLVTVYEPGRMQLIATVRESLALRLKVGDSIPARLDAIDHECLATVSEIVPEAQTASRSFTVKVTGPCPPGVYSGMFGRIDIPLGDEDVLIVPREAVYRVGQLQLVDVVEDDQPRRRSIQVGRLLDEGWEVLAGLQADERVVVRAARKSQEGRP